MQGKASWLNILVTGEIIAIPLITLLFVFISNYCGISQWYTFTFFILAVIDTWCDMYSVRIPARKFSSSIIELKKFLIGQKKIRFYQTCIALPLALIWLILYSTHVLNALSQPLYDGDQEVTVISSVVSLTMGVIAAVIVTIVLYRKMQKTNDRIIADIRDLEAQDSDYNPGFRDRQ